MAIPVRLEKTALKLIDYVYRFPSYPLPDPAAARSCKIISHRGEYDNRQVLENTLDAFDTVTAAGVWGIEFDVRWTRDAEPVVIHDDNMRRLFKSDIDLHRIRLSELHASHAQIPSLETVIGRYGGRAHLMIEIKATRHPEPHIQNQILGTVLAGLQPEKDYHLISLDPAVFGAFDFLPSSALLPIAQLDVAGCSRLARQNNYGGILGHYVLVSDQRIQKHRASGQRVGTGFINSLNCLFREMNRKVEWIFSDRALALQSALEGRLSSAGADHPVKT
jgi:glycerophosphoryl diester phosphodiesterase